ncbi:PASTA domain-containing protein [Streptomyces ipomoeae]|uniref:PASTA domain-containing protein n=1 Tax=Streptomyces ipomoeae TaxID=103232 RepID=UPI001146234E|nr:PASTA domain-containing protein [Streptomyces ipomoeae]TQE34454.1 PASTA domain-containing protein [Streptomyces ipomoeae]
MKRIRGTGRGRTALAAGGGRGAVSLLVIVIVIGLMTTGCSLIGRVAVRAVARGVPSAAPFFRQALALGTDIAIDRALSGRGGEKDGGEAGLYGGTTNPLQCDKGKLVEFLRKPENRRKAEQWAEVKGLGGVDEIAGYVEKLTPVLLRGDTLVKNHDYKKGKAKPFDALLEAGIAILVDALGEPAVQCSCGNPLSAFDHDIDEADVKFDGRNKKWSSYDKKKVAKVKPVAEEDEVEEYKLVNVEKPTTGLARETGTDGSEDEVLPEAPTDDVLVGSSTPTDVPTSDPSDTLTGEPTPTGTLPEEVPDVQGQLAEDARSFLESQGFRVTILDEVTGTAAPPGTIVRQTPEAYSPTPEDGAVTLIMEAVVAPPTDPTVTDRPTDDSGGVDGGMDGGLDGGLDGGGDGGGGAGGAGEDAGGADAGGTDAGTFGSGGM